MQTLDERAELAAAIADIASTEMPIERLRQVADAGAFDAALWQKLTDAGLFSLLLPERLGGLDLTLADAVGIFFELGRHPVPGPVMDNAIAVPLLRKAASNPGAIDETMILAVADPEGTTRARSSVTVGDGRLRGRVDLVRGAAVAHAFLVVAGDTVFVVPRDAPGVSIEADYPMDLGLRYAGVSFESAVRDATELVAGPDGQAAIGAMRSGLRLAMAAEVSGAGRAMLALATEYALVRSQFGRTIGSFQAVQQMLAQTYEHCTTLESLLEWCTQGLDGATPDEASLLAIKAKAGASEWGRLIAENTLQVHGGIGFTAEYDLSVFYQRILAIEAQYGDSMSLGAVIGRRLLEGG